MDQTVKQWNNLPEDLPDKAPAVRAKAAAGPGLRRPTLAQILCLGPLVLHIFFVLCYSSILLLFLDFY